MVYLSTKNTPVNLIVSNIAGSMYKALGMTGTQFQEVHATFNQCGSHFFGYWAKNT